MSDYRERGTIEPGKRGGKPCIRSMRITVYDVLDWLASGGRAKKRRTGSFRVSLRRASLLIALKNEDRE
ncbi:MAG TPA: DUF433 domain-containing protein [Gammaproteobacteria bacterium]|jgi:Protein of unknown function (DUF433)|nr:DUF433 domain-containing protein [Gammaproteobacteria bacterium]